TANSVADTAATPNSGPASDTSASSVTINTTITDTTGPTVLSVNSSTANGTYNLDDSISIQVSFNEVVTVTGTPTLELETGTTDRTVNYASGSGSSTLTFTYSVQSGDTSLDLDFKATNSLVGTITDAATNAATLTLPSPGAANSLGANKAIIIDTTGPTVSSIDATADDTYNAGEIVEISVTFSENIAVTGSPLLAVTLTSTPATRNAVFSYAAGATAYFNYTVVCGDPSGDLTTASDSLSLNGGSITDIGGTAATSLTISSTLGSVAAVIISTTGCAADTTAPTVTLAATDATSTSATITFTVTGNEDITCSTLSTSTGTDFTFTNISAITSIVQTSATVCTITATSTAIADGNAVVSTLTAAASFSMTDTAGNAQTTLTGSPKATTVTRPAGDVKAPVSSGSITATRTNSTSVTVAYTATDAVSVSTVTAYYSTSADLSSPTSCGSATSLSGTSLSGNITCTIGSSNGTTYYIYTRATDSSSNTETA
ncbi:MAG: beta strand repeat-containing protein, partial [Ilumatobacteraceae bacterium]